MRVNRTNVKIKKLTPDNSLILKELFPESRAPGLETRWQVMAAFLRLLVTKGFENITFEELARTTRLSKAHVYHFFKSSDELLLCCVDFIARGGQATSARQVAGASDPFARVLAVSDAAFDWYSDHPGFLSVLILAIYKSAFDRRYQQILERIRSHGIAHIESLLPAGLTATPGGRSALATQIQTTIIGQLLVANSMGREGYQGFRLSCRDQVRKLLASESQK